MLMPVCASAWAAYRNKHESRNFCQDSFVFVSMNILILKNKKAGSHYPSPPLSISLHVQGQIFEEPYINIPHTSGDHIFGP